jgi:hypothetical protein
MQRIGVLMGYAESNVEGQTFVAAFREGLLKLGWAEGRNLRSDYRWGPPGDADATRRFAKELVALQPSLILTHNTATTAAALEQTHTIPIVFAIVADPVGSGFVTNFSRPGGNASLDVPRQAVHPAGAILVSVAPIKFFVGTGYRIFVPDTQHTLSDAAGITFLR